MDAYERLARALKEMSPADRERELSRMRAECICPDCPTYTECAGEREERLYCFLGKSPECITDELGCICPDCPVAAEAGLVNLYFCTTGSERSMREGRG